MRGAVSALSQYVSMEWCLVKHRDNFNFIIIIIIIIFGDGKTIK